MFESSESKFNMSYIAGLSSFIVIGCECLWTYVHNVIVNGDLFALSVYLHAYSMHFSLQCLNVSHKTIIVLWLLVNF